MASIILTTRCNLHCPYCFASGFVNREKSDIIHNAFPAGSILHHQDRILCLADRGRTDHSSRISDDHGSPDCESKGEQRQSVHQQHILRPVYPTNDPPESHSNCELQFSPRCRERNICPLSAKPGSVIPALQQNKSD